MALAAILVFEVTCDVLIATPLHYSLTHLLNYSLVIISIRVL